MTDRPAPLQLVDDYLAGARLAHEYVYVLSRELMERGADGDRTRRLVRESAAVAAELMPELAQRLRRLEREWNEQALLDPPAADRTAKRLESNVAKIAPELAALSNRQKQIVAELLEIVARAR